jgi:nitrate/TMAO reductase-like tetraheme cytochrome c subunit
MSGGFKRLATVIKELKARGEVAWIDTGDIIDVPGRQSQLKAETYGELMGALGVDAVAYTKLDQRQGVGLVVSAASLSGKKWLTPAPDSLTPTQLESNVFGVTLSAVNEQSLDFQSERPTDVILLDGAVAIASKLSNPHQLVVFSSDGIPTVNGKKVSPGSNLRGVIVATFNDTKLISSKVVQLESSIKEDANAEKIYRNYLNRVTKERLIDGVTKTNSNNYAGSANCKSCHGKIYNQFLLTKHAKAYNSLVKEGHQADPDCVGCHVVGLDSTKGFLYQRTHQLAQVGCESCHGPGRDHARSPKTVHLPKVKEETCISCHTPSNSPSFVFKTFWKKIKH